MRTHDPSLLPGDLPEPLDDGTCAHLSRTAVPRTPLPSTDGGVVDLSTLPGRVIVYAYPRTGRPGVPTLTPDWDVIPGARGCTPQSCGFRDHFAELIALGVAAVFGLSTQDTAYQREMVERLHLPFPVLSDSGLRLADSLRLPTFVAKNMILLKRVTLVIDEGVITKVFFPVFPPQRSAEDVIAWLRTGERDGSPAPR